MILIAVYITNINITKQYLNNNIFPLHVIKASHRINGASLWHKLIVYYNEYFLSSMIKMDSQWLN